MTALPTWPVAAAALLTQPAASGSMGEGEATDSAQELKRKCINDNRVSYTNMWQSRTSLIMEKTHSKFGVILVFNCEAFLCPLKLSCPSDTLCCPL